MTNPDNDPLEAACKNMWPGFSDKPDAPLLAFYRERMADAIKVYLAVAERNRLASLGWTVDAKDGLA